MPVTADKIAQMELALEQAKAEYERENGRRYEIIMREIAPEEKQRILESLTDRHERILFGLEAPERSARPGKSGGDLTCPICGKTGLTELGLKLHTARLHKAGQGRGEASQHADMFPAPEGAKSPRRRVAKSAEEEVEGE